MAEVRFCSSLRSKMDVKKEKSSENEKETEKTTTSTKCLKMSTFPKRETREKCNTQHNYYWQKKIHVLVKL